MIPPRYVQQVKGQWVCRVCGSPTTDPLDDYGNGYHLTRRAQDRCEASLKEAGRDDQ